MPPVPTSSQGDFAGTVVIRHMGEHGDGVEENCEYLIAHRAGYHIGGSASDMGTRPVEE